MLAMNDVGSNFEGQLIKWGPQKNESTVNTSMVKIVERSL